METGVRAVEPSDGLLCRYPAEGDLHLADGTSAAMTRGAETALRFVPGREGTGVYLQQGTALSIPVSKLNPQEGTLAFWFRPDWSDPCYRHSILAELAVGDAWRLRWLYGYPHIPNGIYVEANTGPKWTGAKAAGSLYGHSHNLFSGGEWRHYALRWSAKRGAIEMVVDGYKCPEGGRYTCGEIEPRDAHLLLSGEVRGAFDEARVYNRWLDDAELIAAEGVTEVKAYLQEQQPPGARRMGGAGRQVSFVEPATGERVTTTQTDAGGLYDPDDMPELPKTPHTRWARPLAAGSLKVLMVMPAEFFNDLQTQLREGVELWQRLDMTCHIGNRMCPEIATNDYDVIVVSHQGHVGGWQGWTSIEEPLRRLILERVNGGRSGLVLTYPRNFDSSINALLKKRRP
ncbi:MAG: hypothetical protein PHR35_06435, partial [Kiritimatiellae bacterium]|nr:hypothetical protein [Kiritimatiellia bacterium]